LDVSSKLPSIREIRPGNSPLTVWLVWSTSRLAFRSSRVAKVDSAWDAISAGAIAAEFVLAGGVGAFVDAGGAGAAWSVEQTKSANPTANHDILRGIVNLPG
jgi:hypothetical protein